MSEVATLHAFAGSGEYSASEEAIFILTFAVVIAAIQTAPVGGYRRDLR